MKKSQKVKQRRKTFLVPGHIETWLVQNYEVLDGGVVGKEAMYDEYQDYCLSIGEVPKEKTIFSKLVFTVFPSVGSCRLGPLGHQVPFFAGLAKTGENEKKMRKPVKKRKRRREPSPLKRFATTKNESENEDSEEKDGENENESENETIGDEEEERMREKERRKKRKRKEKERSDDEFFPPKEKRKRKLEEAMQQKQKGNELKKKDKKGEDQEEEGFSKKQHDLGGDVLSSSSLLFKTANMQQEEEERKKGNQENSKGRVVGSFFIARMEEGDEESSFDLIALTQTDTTKHTLQKVARDLSSLYNFLAHRQATPEISRLLKKFATSCWPLLPHQWHWDWEPLLAKSLLSELELDCLTLCLCTALFCGAAASHEVELAKEVLGLCQLLVRSLWGRSRDSNFAICLYFMCQGLSCLSSTTSCSTNADMERQDAILDDYTAMALSILNEAQHTKSITTYKLSVYG